MSMEESFRRRPATYLLAIAFLVVLGTLILFFVDDCNNHATAVALGETFGIAEALLAGLALLGFALTVRDLRENQKGQQEQINALTDIARALTDPVVVARKETHDTLQSLVIENMGKSSAYDVQFDVEPKTGIVFMQRHIELSDVDVIKNGLPTMAPGERIRIPIAVGPDVREMLEKGEDFVKEFTLSISYMVQGSLGTLSRRYLQYTFSLVDRLTTMQPRGEVAHELHRLYDLLERAFDGSGSNRTFAVRVKK